MEDACVDLPSVSLDMRLETVHLTGGQGPPHPPPPLCLRWERSRLLLEVLVGYGQGQLEGGREETEGALQEKKPRGGGEGNEEQHEGPTGDLYEEPPYWALQLGTGRMTGRGVRSPPWHSPLL